MNKFLWRVGFAWRALTGLVTGQPVDLGVVAFFLTPGSLRNPVFGPTYVARRFLRRFGLGDVVRDGDLVRLTIADLRFAIPVRGFEQGDVLDILYPYALTRMPEIGDRVAAYMRTNTDRFYDGPYLSARTRIEPGMTVVDAGASMGLFTVTASRLVGDAGRVIACEPVAEARALLQENLDANGCANVTVVPAALGEESRMVELDINLDAHFEGSSKYISRSGTKREVQQHALDDLLPSMQVEKIGFLKADIEGSERDLLAGARRTLAASHPVLAIRTYHLPDDVAVLSALVTGIGGYAFEVERGTTLYGWQA